MSADNCPQVPGGTTENKGERFGIFRTIDQVVESKDEIPEVTEIESLCMSCHENGMTRLLLTQIPYFREVILMSFNCEHCGFSNNEVQFGGKVAEKGCKMQLVVTTAEDLNRQIIKSDTATVLIKEVEFEIPAKTQRGVINTIEGMLQKAIMSLRENQEERRLIDSETTSKIDDVLAKLSMMACGISLPFTIIIDDPSGNSFLENPNAPLNDSNMSTTYYFRSELQDLECGLQPDQTHEQLEEQPRPVPQRNEGLDALTTTTNFAKKEVITFPTNCYSCGVLGQTCMCMTDIPHFKEVIIMSFICDACGFKSNEIKGGGAIPPLGEEISLHVTGEDMELMNRDILKSDSAAVSIPELELEMAPGSLGGLYTTVEGLLQKIRLNIAEGNPFGAGDSDGGRSLLNKWLEKLDSLITGKVPFHIILRDPLANSFIYSPFGDNSQDPLMEFKKYERSEEENEDLGLNDICIENYNRGVEQDKNAIVSDKESMLKGGRALHPDEYHPNPNAVMNLDDKKT